MLFSKSCLHRLAWHLCLLDLLTQHLHDRLGALQDVDAPHRVVPVEVVGPCTSVDPSARIVCAACDGCCRGTGLFASCPALWGLQGLVASRIAHPRTRDLGRMAVLLADADDLLVFGGDSADDVLALGGDLEADNLLVLGGDLPLLDS